MEKQTVPCPVIRDLIPLCHDEVASAESRKLVERHIAGCGECRREYEESGAAVPPAAAAPQIQGEQGLIRRIRRRSYQMLGLFLVVGAVLGALITFDSNVFYNFLLMPVLGAAGYFLCRPHLYIPPVFVAAATLLCGGAATVVASESFYGFLSYAIYAGLYAMLTLLGVLIGFLLRYAFSRAG